MKKINPKLLTILGFLYLNVNLMFAQVNIEVKTIELVGNGKSKTSKIVKSEYDPATKESKLIFVKTLCDGYETSDASSRTFTAKELKYSFENLIFDKDFNFKKIEKEDIGGLQNAIMKYPVLGVNVELNSNYGYLIGANQKGHWLNQYEYAVKTYVTTRDNQFYCDQKLNVQKTGLELPFPGESVLFSNSTRDGLLVLTQNSQSETTVNVRYFDHFGTQKKQKSFTVNYGFAAKAIVLKNEKGGEDIVVIIQPTEKYNKYGIKINDVKTNPLEFEYVRIDGISLEVKERFIFNASSSQWIPEYVVEKDGAVYVFGQAASKVKMNSYQFGGIMTTEGLSFPNNIRIDELENYQFMKVKNGKAEYVTSLTPDQMSGVENIIPGEKGKNNASGYFRKQEIKIVDGKIYLTGQNTKTGSNGDDRKQEFIMMIDEKGKLTNLFFVPKSNYANSNMFITPDKKTMYWAIYDYSQYEITSFRMVPTQIGVAGQVIGGDDHAFSEKRKIDEGPELQIVKFDLTNNTAGSLEIIGKDEFTLFDENPVLYSNDTEVVFLGIAGKIKERVSKIITLKF